MKYQLLTQSDVIEDTDEFLLDDAETWEPLNDGHPPTVGSRWMVGKRYDPRVFQPMRRPIGSATAEVSEQDKETEQ